jgi:hypothetical protein
VINQSLREVMQTADPFTSVSQHRGGTLIATVRGRGIPVGFDTLLNGDRHFPSGGGLLATALPERQPNGPEAFVVLALGIQAPGPIPVPGFANRLGLDAGVLIVIGARQIPNSADTAAFAVTFPRLPPGSVIAMEAALVWLIAANYFSNNSEILM